MDGKIESILKRAFWVPFVLGMIGYWLIGQESFIDAVYECLALYFVNPVSDITNIFVILSKFTAFFIAASAVLTMFLKLINNVDHAKINREPDSTAVYGDNEWTDRFVANLNHGYKAELRKNGQPENANYQVIMYSDDVENINFYTEQLDFFKNKPTFVMLNNTDSHLLANTAGRNVHYFNLNDLSARMYWKNNDLYDQVMNRNEQIIKIAIIGSNPMAEAILERGYLINLYRLTQKIEYHVWGYKGAKRKEMEKLYQTTMNGDSVTFYETEWNNDLSLFAQMSRVIICEEEKKLAIMQMLLHQYNGLSIHCWNQSGTKYEQIFNAPGLKTFGDLSEILTEECIKEEKPLRQAKLFNYDYTLRKSGRTLPDNYEEEMEKEWVQLDGFTRDSNISRTDHIGIEKKLRESGTDQTELFELEHIRFCRYHYVNHWTYDPLPDTEGTKDKVHRKHKLLIPFEDLPQSEKVKDGIYDSRVKEEIEKLI